MHIFNLLPAACLPRFVPTPPEPIENKTIKFSTTVSYSPTGFVEAFKSKSYQNSSSFDPIHKSLIDSVALELEEVKDFKEYLFEEFDHEAFDFVPQENESWIKLLGTSFKNFTELHFEESVDLVEKVILPYYPILTDSLAVFVIMQHLKENTIDIVEVFDKEVLRVFHDKLEHLFETSMGKEEAETMKTSILWQVRRRMKPGNPAFRYHYAFLLNVPMKDLITIQLPGIEGFTHVSEYIATLAESVYQQLTAETAKVALGLVLPNVYDLMEEDRSYSDVIEIYSKHQEGISDTASFVRRVKYFIKTSGSNGFEHISNEQHALLMMLTSGLPRHKKLLQFAAKNFLYPPQLSVNSQVAYWKALTFSLMVRFSALYPVEAFEFGFRTVPHLAEGLKREYLSDLTPLDLQFFAKFGLTEAFKHCFDEFFAEDKEEPATPMIIPEGNAGLSLANQLFEATKDGSLLANLTLYNESHTFDVTIDKATIDQGYDYSGLSIYSIAYKQDETHVFNNPIRYSEIVYDGDDEEKQAPLLVSQMSSSTTEANDLIGEIIFYAVNFGRKTINRIILTRFEEINYAKAILTAVQNRRFAMAKILLEKAKEISKRDMEMILGEVVRAGNFEMFEYFIGAEKFAVDPMLVPDLIVLAAMSGCLELIKYYLDSKPEQIGNTPRIFCTRGAFEVAVVNNHLDIVRYLDDFLKEEIYNFGPALEAASRMGHLEILEYFLDMKDIDEDALEAAIIEAARYDNQNVIEMIVAKHPNYSKGFGEALVKAATYGHLKTFKYLLHTFPLIAGTFIRSAFVSAVRGCNFDVVKLLKRVHEDELNEETMAEAREELMSKSITCS